MSRIGLTRPFTQNLLVGCILFCLPGIYTALTGLGAGGGRPTSADVANNTNAILYGLFSLVSLFGGPLVNILRPKVALMIGSLGYPLYVGGLWYYDRTGHEWFPLFSGAMLGLTAGFLWTAAAYIQFSYAEEKDKGLYISIQWTLRSLGAIVGSSISLALSINQTKPVGVSTPVYIVFIIIHSTAFFIALFLMVSPKKVVRNDGTHIAVFRKAKLLPELKGIIKVMFAPKYLLTAPAQLVCEMALALVSSVNSRYFNLRTRSVNNFAFQAMQALIPPVLVYILDNKRIASRRTRGLLGMGIMGTIAVSASAGFLAWLEVNGVDDLSGAAGRDWSDKEWPGVFVCYVLFGAVYAGYQMCTEYTLSSTTNDPEVLAHVAGMFKFYSSLGMMISFLMAGVKVSFLGQITMQLVLYTLGIIGIVCVIVFYVKESNYFVEENVIAPVAVEQKMMEVVECENAPERSTERT